MQDNSWTAARSSVKFSTNMFLDNRTKHREFQRIIGQRSRSQDRIWGFFTIARLEEKFVSTITHEPLHLGWWYFARTCTSTTSRTLLNFKAKGQGHMGHFFVFLCAWYCGYPRTVLSLEQGFMILFQLRSLRFSLADVNSVALILAATLWKNIKNRVPAVTLQL